MTDLDYLTIYLRTYWRQDTQRTKWLNWDDGEPVNGWTRSD